MPKMSLNLYITNSTHPWSVYFPSLDSFITVITFLLKVYDIDIVLKI